MMQRFGAAVVCAGLLLAPCLTMAQSAAAKSATAQSAANTEYNTNTWSQEDGTRIVGEVRKQLLSLPNYAVFDSLAFAIKGRTIVLEGYASRPTLKDDAGRAVKNIKGVEGVDNQIKVLPLSPMDDRIRAAVYVNIYSTPQLRKYTGAPVGFGRMPGGIGGITNNPPLGYHAIHIIVDHGNVKLTGVVNNEVDANLAFLKANGTSGVFSVDNDLLTPGESPSAKKAK